MMLFYFSGKFLKEFPYSDISGKVLRITDIWVWGNNVFYKLPECVANICNLFKFSCKFYLNCDPFLFTNSIFGYFGQSASRDYILKLTKHYFSISCPNVSRIFVTFLILHENFTLAMMLFIFRANFWKNFHIWPFRAKCVARL